MKLEFLEYLRNLRLFTKSYFWLFQAYGVFKRTIPGEFNENRHFCNIEHWGVEVHTPWTTFCGILLYLLMSFLKNFGDFDPFLYNMAKILLMIHMKLPYTLILSPYSNLCVCFSIKVTADILVKFSKGYVKIWILNP